MPCVDPAFEDDKLKNIFQYYAIDPEEMGKWITFFMQRNYWMQKKYGKSLAGITCIELKQLPI